MKIFTCFNNLCHIAFFGFFFSLLTASPSRLQFNLFLSKRRRKWLGVGKKLGFFVFCCCMFTTCLAVKKKREKREKSLKGKDEHNLLIVQDELKLSSLSPHLNALGDDNKISRRSFEDFSILITTENKIEFGGK